jgi:hypothetical protein
MGDRHSGNTGCTSGADIMKSSDSRFEKQATNRRSVALLEQHVVATKIRNSQARDTISVAIKVRCASRKSDG